MKRLEVQDYKGTLTDLIEHIENEHAYTQAVLMQEYPYEISMNEDQFKYLAKQAGKTLELKDKVTQLYVTNSGYVMEIIVK